MKKKITFTDNTGKHRIGARAEDPNYIKTSDGVYHNATTVTNIQEFEMPKKK